MIDSRKLTRRALLASTAALAGTVVFSLLYRQDEPEFDAELEALKLAAARKAPAIARLDTITPRHHAKPLPFEPDAIPGFSPATHRIHYENHYLEYLWRVENGERTLFRLAADAGRANPSAPMSQLLAVYTELRVSLNMLLLHDLYWNQLGRKTSSLATSRVAGIRKEMLSRVGPDDDWVFVVETPDRECRIATLNVPMANFPREWRLVGGIDLPRHAWGLDHPNVESYVDAFISVLGDEDLDRWDKALGQPSLEPPTMPAASREITANDNLISAIAEINQAHETPLAHGEIQHVLAGLQRLAGAEGRIDLVTTSYDVIDLDISITGQPSGIACIDRG